MPLQLHSFIRVCCCFHPSVPRLLRSVASVSTVAIMIHILRETHDAPADVARELVLAGGLNRFGEPNYRAVWGWSRLDWIGGKWEDRDASGALVREVVELRREPKYTPHNRWHIERWMPPESYGSPEQWRAETIEIENGRSIPGAGAVSHRAGITSIASRWKGRAANLCN